MSKKNNLGLLLLSIKRHLKWEANQPVDDNNTQREKI